MSTIGDVARVAGGIATVSNAGLDPVQVGIRHPSITAGGTALLGLRPQYLNPDDPAGRLHGRVALTERLARDASHAIGAEISLGFDPAMAHLFAAQGGPQRAGRQKGRRWQHLAG